MKAHQDSNGYWWAKDTTGHGGAAYKVFEKKGNIGRQMQMSTVTGLQISTRVRQVQLLN